MIELYKPDMYQKDIYSIDYKKLKSYGIKCILFDLDNTLVAPYIKKPPRKLKDFIERIKDMKFKVIIYSNASKKRISPFVYFININSKERKFVKRRSNYFFNRILFYKRIWN